VTLIQFAMLGMFKNELLVCQDYSLLYQLLQSKAYRVGVLVYSSLYQQYMNVSESAAVLFIGLVCDCIRPTSSV